MRARALTIGAAAAAAALATAGCGGNTEHAARQAVGTYFSALGAGDASKACRQLTSESQDQIAKIGAQLLMLHDRSCKATIDRVLHSPAGPRLRRLAHARVTRVETDHGEVRAFVAGLAGSLELKRDGGGWRIAGEPMLETD